MALKLLELTIFLSPNLSVSYFNFVYGVGVRSDQRRFSVHSPFIEKSVNIYNTLVN